MYFILYGIVRMFLEGLRVSLISAVVIILTYGLIYMNKLKEIKKIIHNLVRKD